MDKKKTLLGIWLMLMTLLALTAFTTYFVAQIRFTILLYSYSALVISQLFSLIVFLIGSKKLKNKILRAIYKMCCIISLTVIPAFIFIFIGLVSQYHANIKESIAVSDTESYLLVPKDGTTVYKTDTFYVFFPEYTHIDLECGIRPKKSDKSITWCSAAAFQHEVQLDFNDNNIEGFHASKGKYSDSDYVKPQYGAVVFYDGGYRFEFDDPEAAIKEAADHGGSGFMQYRLIEDGIPVTDFSMPRVRSFRAIAEINGNICIVDSIDMMEFEDFLNKLDELGFTNALYMDMGAGWNYSWYRQNNGMVKMLYELKVPWSHNWVVFRK